jgi:hypothetical protein
MLSVQAGSEPALHARCLDIVTQVSVIPGEHGFFVFNPIVPKRESDKFIHIKSIPKSECRILNIPNV